jgi:hypothetical protein
LMTEEGELRAVRREMEVARGDFWQWGFSWPFFASKEAKVTPFIQCEISGWMIGWVPLDAEEFLKHILVLEKCIRNVFHE